MTRLVSESNAVIKCLNEMYHPLNNFQHVGPPSLSQRTAQHCVFSQLARQQLPAVTCKVREAAQELLQKRLSYSGEEAGSATVSYDRRLVSLPEVAAEPITVFSVLDGPGRDVVEDASHCMLWGPQEWGVEKNRTSQLRPIWTPSSRTTGMNIVSSSKICLRRACCSSHHTHEISFPFFCGEEVWKAAISFEQSGSEPTIPASPKGGIGCWI